jgi:hypothetical protein
MLKGRRSILGMTLSDILSPVFCDCPLKYYIKVPIEGDPGGGEPLDAGSAGLVAWN